MGSLVLGRNFAALKKVESDFSAENRASVAADSLRESLAEAHVTDVMILLRARFRDDNNPNFDCHLKIRPEGFPHSQQIKQAVHEALVEEAHLTDEVRVHLCLSADDAQRLTTVVDEAIDALQLPTRALSWRWGKRNEGIDVAMGKIPEVQQRAIREQILENIHQKVPGIEVHFQGRFAGK